MPVTTASLNLKKQVKGLLENLQIFHAMFSKKSIFHLDIKMVTVVINFILPVTGPELAEKVASFFMLVV